MTKEMEPHAAWRDWLEKHHCQRQQLLVGFYKKGAEAGCRCACSMLAQWCLPPRRQHAGNVESLSTDTSGPISEKRKKAGSRIAQERLRALIGYNFGRPE